MTIPTVEFVELEKQLRKTKKSYLDVLAPELGKAYIIAITRDGCPECEKQKPLLDNLAAKMMKKHGDKVVFTRIHVKYTQEFTEESLRAKNVFRHYFYPTNIILVKTPERDAFECYRLISPEMKDLEKYIEIAVEIADALTKES